MLRTLVRRPQGSKILTYKAFLSIQICLWFYTIAWFSMLTYIYYFWDTQLIYKIIATVALAILTPDAHTLFQTYHQYRDELNSLSKK